MKIINPITTEIIRKAKEGETIRSISQRTGFAYSAVYFWINKLAKLDVFVLEKKGNKTIIRINSNEIYTYFKGLIEKIIEYEKDSSFWNLIKKTPLRARLGKETSAVIWVKGGYITNDFYNKIYYIDVTEKDYSILSKELKNREINFSKKTDNIASKPFIIIKIIKKPQIIRINGLPVASLSEVVSWCKKLKLEPILEQLNLIYKVPIKKKYSEVFTND